MDGLTDAQIEALLYGETSIELDGVSINGRFDFECGEKNSDIVKRSSHTEISLVANDMTAEELKV